MIKKFLYLAMVALAATTFVACGDDDDDNNNNQNNGVVQLATPPYKNEAKVVNLTDNEANIKQLRMMRNGSYMMALEREANENWECGTRADLVNFLYLFGKFTYENGVFMFDNGMKITFQSTGNNTYDVTITWEGGTTIKTTGTLDTSKSVTPGVMTDNLCSHAWKVETLYAACKFNGKKVYKEFAGPTNLFDVKKWFEDNVGTLKDQFDAGTVIEGIYFDAEGLFAIDYLNRTDDVGVWRWSDMNAGKFVYSWNNAATAISLFTGDASVSFSKNPDTCLLTLKGNVNNADLEFIFTLK